MAEAGDDLPRVARELHDGLASRAHVEPPAMLRAARRCRASCPGALEDLVLGDGLTATLEALKN